MFVAHVLFSWVFGISKNLPGSDMATHVLGGVAIAYCSSKILTILCRRRVIGDLEIRVRTVLVFALTATAAVFWEFAEFGVDSYLGTRIQVDLANTMSDMALGILGCVVFLILQNSFQKDG